MRGREDLLEEAGLSVNVASGCKTVCWQPQMARETHQRREVSHIVVKQSGPFYDNANNGLLFGVVSRRRYRVFVI